jgi:cobalamin biosynthesis Mg chelatase CobN
VQLLKNGEVQEDQTVTLSAANNWQYTWTGLDDTAEWTAVEKEVPENYTVMTSLEDNDSRLVIINTEKTPETPSETPQPETPQSEVLQSETPQSETPQSESAQTEETPSGPTQSEAPQSDGAQTEETQSETSEETTSTEGPVTKTSQGTTSSSSGTGTLPQTGMLLWPIPVLAIAGMVLFVIGWILHRKCW